MRAAVFIPCLLVCAVIGHIMYLSTISSFYLAATAEIVDGCVTCERDIFLPRNAAMLARSWES